MQTANKSWATLVRRILDEGQPVSPRHKPTLEILASQTCVDMRQPVLSLFARKLGYKFLAAEAHWILSGDNRVKTIAPYSKTISMFSDDRLTFQGAYGPKIMDQFYWAAITLLGDFGTRQAVINIWRERPIRSKDVPCSLNVQWLIRQSKLHCILTMRSSDVWLGWPYDIFNFSMITTYMLLYMRHLYRDEDGRAVYADDPNKLSLGNIYLNAGSQHLYEQNWMQAQDAMKAYEADKFAAGFEYAWLDVNDFKSPEDLMQHLAWLKDGLYHNCKAPFLVDALRKPVQDKS